MDNPNSPTRRRRSQAERDYQFAIAIICLWLCASAQACLNLAVDFRLADHAHKLQTLPPQRSYIRVTFRLEPTFA
jgi:hypothetical protein